MAIPSKNVLGNPNVTEGNFQIAIEQLRESVIGSGKTYDSANTYMEYDICYYGGVVYYSKINNNTGNTPSIGENWGDYTDLLLGVVHKTGDETIAGVKTFSSSPIVPTPTAGTQAVNKDYADLKVALESFIGANQNLTSSGYQILPGGLIIQWGTVALNTLVAKTWSDKLIIFPIAFSISALKIIATVDEPVSNQLITTACGSLSATQARIYLNSELPITNQYIKYIVIGK